MTLILIFLYIEACCLILPPPPAPHLIKEMRQKTEYVTKSLYNKVLNSN